MMACARTSASVLSGHCLELLAAHGRLHTREHTWETTILENMMHMPGVQTSLLLQMPCRIQTEPANWVEPAYDHCQHRTSSPPSTILGGRQSLQASNVAWYNRSCGLRTLARKERGCSNKVLPEQGRGGIWSGGRPFGGLSVSSSESAGLWAGIPLGPSRQDTRSPQPGQ